MTVFLSFFYCCLLCHHLDFLALTLAMTTWKGTSSGKTVVDVRMFSGVLSLLHFITGIMCTSNFNTRILKVSAMYWSPKLKVLVKSFISWKKHFWNHTSSMSKKYFENKFFKVVYIMHIKLVKLKLTAFLIKMALFKY